MIDNILNFIYPPKCIACGVISDDSADCLCEFCSEDIPRIKTGCSLCGMPLVSEGICYNCIDEIKYFEKNIAVFKYDDVKNMIYRFKYGRKPWIGKVMGQIMSAYLLERHCDVISSSHLVIPVPVHKKKYKFRGFNQSLILAREIAYASKVRLADNVIIRNKETKAQSLVQYHERSDNVKGVFSVTKSVLNKNILLIDDIYTTGSTLNSIGEILKNAECGHIFCATLSISAK